MDSDFALLIITAAACIINFAINFIAFPTRYGKWLSIFIVATYIIAYLATTYFILRTVDGQKKYLDYLGFVSLLVLLCIFKKPALQKIFMLLVLGMLSVSISAFSRILVGLLVPFESSGYTFAHLIVTLLFYSLYFLVFIKLGKQFFDKLFSSESNIDWAIYSSWVVFSLGIFMLLRQAPGSIALHIALWLFIPWTIAVICFLIITLHRRMLAEHERDLSLEILSSGRNYYTKLTEMNEHLACLRHDYKHQLNTMQKMLESGQREEVQAYLAKLRTTAKDGAIMEYCISPALNALLNNFAERCEREGISLTIEIISLPQGVIHDYELCVIVGNLLENAIAACLRTPQGREPFIYLSMRPHEDRYGINVENSFDGILANDGKELHSTKKDGGLGIKSIKATIKRHEGEYLPIWDFENFSAFVVLKLER